MVRRVAVSPGEAAAAVQAHDAHAAVGQLEAGGQALLEQQGGLRRRPDDQLAGLREVGNAHVILGITIVLGVRHVLVGRE